MKKLPYIEINTWSGKDIETKRRLVEEVTKAVISVLDIKPKMVSIIIRDIPKENWAVGGVLDVDKNY